MLSRNEIERWHRSSSEENNMVTAITDANFAEKTKDGLVLIDFWAAWCGPCRMQTPILEKLAEEVHEDELKIFKMDVDANPNTPSEFGIMSIPTLIFKKDGQVVKQVVGVHTKEQLKAIVAELS
ncbi:thioredoxin [Streptococcus constellatus]|uniref:thioredoxin n=2 Tax=Streptococcus anginosus group TaxID=671232 RepID=UPI0028EF6A5C|nr:thioredoxin [Streptococcus constellatus]